MNQETVWSPKKNKWIHLIWVALSVAVSVQYGARRQQRASVASPDASALVAKRAEAVAKLPALASARPSLPEAPFVIRAPNEPSNQLDGVDLRRSSGAALMNQAIDAAADEEWDVAAQLQHWALVRDPELVFGRYNLACYHARSGRVDAAIFWIQRAVIEESVDLDTALEDEDLASVRNDPRWPALRDFLSEASQYWLHHPVKTSVLTLPAGYTKGRAIPVVIALHGYGSTPKDFSGPMFQRIADDLDLAFLSVSGTLSMSKNSFRWTELVERDESRLDEALAEVRDRVTFAENKLVLMGFSQGAQMSAEMVARHPQRWAGAVVMSPGTAVDLGLEDLPSSPVLEKRRFVLVAGAEEHPRTVFRLNKDARVLGARGADVALKLYDGMSTHAFPADIQEAMPVWLRFILENGPRPEAAP